MYLLLKASITFSDAVIAEQFLKVQSETAKTIDGNVVQMQADKNNLKIIVLSNLNSVTDEQTILQEFEKDAKNIISVQVKQYIK